MLSYRPLLPSWPRLSPAPWQYYSASHWTIFCVSVLVPHTFIYSGSSGSSSRSRPLTLAGRTKDRTKPPHYYLVPTEPADKPHYWSYLYSWALQLDPTNTSYNSINWRSYIVTWILGFNNEKVIRHPKVQKITSTWVKSTYILVSCCKHLYILYYLCLLCAHTFTHTNNLTHLYWLVKKKKKSCFKSQQWV